MVSVIYIHFNGFIIGFRIPAGKQEWEVGKMLPGYFLYRDR